MNGLVATPPRRANEKKNGCSLSKFIATSRHRGMAGNEGMARSEGRNITRTKKYSLSSKLGGYANRPIRFGSRGRMDLRMNVTATCLESSSVQIMELWTMVDQSHAFYSALKFPTDLYFLPTPLRYSWRLYPPGIHPLRQLAVSQRPHQANTYPQDQPHTPPIFGTAKCPHGQI